MFEAGLPVDADTPREYARTQGRVVPAGQDQEPAVVDDKLEPAVPKAEVPPDPAISCATFQGRRRHAWLL